MEPKIQYAAPRKISLKDAALIRQARKNGETTLSLAKRYGVTHQHIAQIGKMASGAPDLRIRVTDEVLLALCERAESENVTPETLASRLFGAVLDSERKNDVE